MAARVGPRWRIRMTTAALVLVAVTCPNVIGSGAASGQPVAVRSAASATQLSPATNGLNPVRSVRLLDTRSGVGWSGPVPAHGTVRLVVAGRGGLPASGIGAVVINVTVTEPRAAGYLTVFADGASRPGTSNVNFSVSQTIANLVIDRKSVV